MLFVHFVSNRSIGHSVPRDISIIFMQVRQRFVGYRRHNELYVAL